MLFAFMPEYLAQSSRAVKAGDLQHRVGKDGPAGLLSAGGPPNQQRWSTVLPLLMQPFPRHRDKDAAEKCSYLR